MTRILLEDASQVEAARRQDTDLLRLPILPPPLPLLPPPPLMLTPLARSLFLVAAVGHCTAATTSTEADTTDAFAVAGCCWAATALLVKGDRLAREHDLTVAFEGAAALLQQGEEALLHMDALHHEARRGAPRARLGLPPPPASPRKSTHRRWFRGMSTKLAPPSLGISPSSPATCTPCSGRGGSAPTKTQGVQPQRGP